MSVSDGGSGPAVYHEKKNRVDIEFSGIEERWRVSPGTWRMASSLSYSSAAGHHSLSSPPFLTPQTSAPPHPLPSPLPKHRLHLLPFTPTLLSSAEALSFRMPGQLRSISLPHVTLIIISSLEDIVRQHSWVRVRMASLL